MTNQQLADQLNAELGLTPPAAVSVNVIRQWVAWRLLTPADAKGQGIGLNPEWSRDPEELRKARRLAELRQIGIVTERRLIVQCWFEGRDLPIGSVKKAFLGELESVLAKTRRNVSTAYRYKSGSPLSDAKSAAIDRQGGRQDTPEQILLALFSPGQVAAAFSTTLGGAEYAATFVQAVAAMVPALTHGSVEVADADFAGVLALGLVGVAAEAEETSENAIDRIRNASRVQFELAREFVWALRSMRKSASFGEAASKVPHIASAAASYDILAPEIYAGQWTVPIVAIILNGICQHEDAEIILRSLITE